MARHERELLTKLSQKLEALTPNGHGSENAGESYASASAVSRTLKLVGEIKAQCELLQEQGTNQGKELEALLHSMAELETQMKALTARVDEKVPVPKAVELSPGDRQRLIDDLLRGVKGQMTQMLAENWDEAQDIHFDRKIAARVDHVLAPQVADLATQIGAKLAELGDTIDARVSNRVRKLLPEMASEHLKEAWGRNLRSAVKAEIGEVYADLVASAVNDVISTNMSNIGKIVSQQLAEAMAHAAQEAGAAGAANVFAQLSNEMLKDMAESPVMAPVVERDPKAKAVVERILNHPDADYAKLFDVAANHAKKDMAAEAPGTGPQPDLGPPPQPLPYARSTDKTDTRPTVETALSRVKLDHPGFVMTPVDATQFKPLGQNIDNVRDDQSYSVGFLPEPHKGRVKLWKGYNVVQKPNRVPEGKLRTNWRTTAVRRNVRQAIDLAKQAQEADFTALVIRFDGRADGVQEIMVG